MKGDVHLADPPGNEAGATSTWTPDMRCRRPHRRAAERTICSTTVDFEAAAGPANRWATQAGGPRIRLRRSTAADRKLLVYTGAPLTHDVEMTGQPVISLHVASTHTDGNFFVYVEDVAPTGKVTYVTEGELRALHRKLSNAKSPYRTTYPYRTYSFKDAELMTPGQHGHAHLSAHGDFCTLPRRTPDPRGCRRR